GRRAAPGLPPVPPAVAVLRTAVGRAGLDPRGRLSCPAKVTGMATGLPSTFPNGNPTIGALIRESGPTFSFEFFPPKTPEGHRQLWLAVRELESLRPSFVSITYGAGGSTRDTTVSVTERIATETT